VDRSTSPNPAHRPRSAEAALKLLTGRRELVAARSSERKGVAAFDSGLAGHVLRGVNGLVAAWLGYEAAGLLLTDVGALGVAAGLGVLGYLLPRLAALGVIVALAVALLRDGSGLAFGALLPAFGLVWVGLSSVDEGARRAPLGPLISIPLAAIPLLAGGLGAGVPLLFGVLMRPLGAVLAAALAAVAFVMYDVTAGDGYLPYFGTEFIVLERSLTPTGLASWVTERVLGKGYGWLFSIIPLWAAMALVVSLFEWAGRPLVGLVLGLVVGAIGYGVFISRSGDAFIEAMISLGVAGIILFVARYLGARARG
jgi:hypothetical protein